MDNNLEEIISEALKEESEAPPPPPVEKKKKQATEKQLAALAKGRETRARNKVQKEQIKSQKLQMLEKIHSRVESFDMNCLMRKIESMTQTKVEAVKKEKQTKAPSAEIDPPTPEPEPQTPIEEEEFCHFTRNMRTIPDKKNNFDSGEYSFF